MEQVKGVHKNHGQQEKTNITAVVIIVGILVLMIAAMGYGFMK